MKKTVRKLIIPAAGFGTRFLPATKALAKEMLPILNFPTIHYIVEEAIEAGIEDIIIVVSSQKNSIVDYFDSSFELEYTLNERKKDELLKLVKHISNMANIFFVRQKKQLGLGHAISAAKQFINDEPFAVILGDDLVFTKKGKKNAIKQCIDAFNKCKSTILGVQKVPLDQVNKYGIIKIKTKLNSNLFKIADAIEKPSQENSPSQYAILGRYVLLPEIFESLSKVKFDKSGEIQLTNAIKLMLKKNKNVYAYCFDGNRFDIGNKEGYLKAICYKAYEDPKLKKILFDFRSSKMNNK